MDIFELAKAKKMFGGGGGKREGTAIPYGQPVKKIYFNTENTKEETDALLSQLTYVEGILSSPVHFIYANTLDGDLGYYLYVKKDDSAYEIRLLTSLTGAGGSNEFSIYSSNAEAIHNNGWWTMDETMFYYNGAYWSQTLWIPNAMSAIGSGTTLTDFMGVPIGAENEKIKDVLSITPFFAEKTKPATVEGTAIKAGEVYEKIYFNTKNSIEETNAILSQLTYVDIGIGVPVYFAYAKTADGDTGTFVLIINDGSDYQISVASSLSQARQWDLYYSDTTQKNHNGWEPVYPYESYKEIPLYPTFVDVYEGGQALTDLQGLPIGAENEKIKNVLSITPF